MPNATSSPTAPVLAVLLGALIGSIAATPQARAEKPADFSSRTARVGSAPAAMSSSAAATIANVPVCTAIFDQFGPVVIPDGSGGSILVWEDYRSGSLDIYAQKVNAAGVPQWVENGVPVCKAAGFQFAPRAASDGAGGVLVAWQDARVDTATDIYVQRIGASGGSLWGNGGNAVCTAIGSQTLPVVVADGAGGAVIAWTDDRALDSDVYVQRVSPLGAMQWAANGVAVCLAAGVQENLAAASDGTGGVMLAWRDLRAGAANPDLYVRRVSGTGAPQGAVNGEPLCVAAGAQAVPALVSDGVGGAIATWEDRRSVNADIYVQRVNPAGVASWTLDGVLLCGAAGDQTSPTLCTDGSQGALVAWEDRRGGIADIYGGRVDGAGSPQWSPDGVPVCTAPTDQMSPSIHADVTGGAVLAWSDGRTVANGFDIYAQRIGLDGVVQWSPDGVVLTDAPSHQQRPTILADGLGGAAVAWRDFRPGAHSDIYGQRVNPFGQVPDQCAPPDSLGSSIPFTSMAPQNHRTFNQGWFYWSGVAVRSPASSDWDIEVFDQNSYGLSPYPNCFGNGLAGSYRRSGVDFVVGDFTDNQTPAGVYGMRAFRYSGTDAGTFEWDSGPNSITLASAADTAAGVASVSEWTGPIDVFDVDLSAGVTYTVELRATAPATMLHVFTSYGVPGFVKVFPRSAAILSTGGRFALFTAQVTAPHGIVVTNEDGTPSFFQLKVWSTTPVGVGAPSIARAGLEGVTPNPAPGRAKIAFALREAGTASFDILDLAGRVVAHIPGRQWAPGQGSVEWDGTTREGRLAASGVYFVRMQIQDQRVGVSRFALVR